MKETMFDLQHFADAGTLVNATGNFVNAGTGETTDFDSAHSLSSELKAFYDTELLENARTELFYAQFAKRQPLPANHHGSVEWRKWNTFDKASRLTEGVIPTGQKFGVTAVTGSIDQYGTYTAITDKLNNMQDYDVVYVGFPIWWYTAPTIINTFMEAYDFKGKTVIPFATSGGSSIKKACEDLKAAYPDITWKEGKLLNRTSKKELETWVKGL